VQSFEVIEERLIALARLQHRLQTSGRPAASAARS
jgi:hypothetical protein